MAEGTPSSAVRVRVLGVTDVGRVREHNEDSFLVFDRDANRRSGAGEPQDIADLRTAIVFAVCDGMGGAAAGEVASRMAADRLADVLGKADLGTATADQIAALMDQAVQQANAEILELSRSKPEMKGMGTTLTAAVATRGRLFVSQVGDSRAYLLRNGLLNQITKDQSLIGQLIEEGTLTEEEAEKYGARNIVLQAVGVEETLRVDTKHWPVLRGDVILLCSDGLSGMVKDARIREVLAESGEDIRTAADRLILEANDNGGRDNVTVILARFDGEGLRAPMETTGGDGSPEKAGAGFKAPPPPDVPNPMKKVALFGGLALAGLVGIILATRKTTADVTFPVRPGTVEIELRDAATDAVVRAKAPVTGEARIEGLPPGKYKLLATAPGYFPWDSEFAVERSGQLPLAPLDLQPKSAKVVVTTETPKVLVSLDVTSPHPAYEALRVKDSSLPEKGSSREFGNVPPGKLTLTASRAGFRDHTVTADLKPDATESLRLPALTEIRGRIVVEAPTGAGVEVLSAEGESLARGTAAEGAFSAEVRIGDATVVVTAPGFETVRASANVTEGGTASVKPQARQAEVAVSFRGVPKEQVEFQVREGDGWTGVRNADIVFLNPAGQSPRAYRVPPGRYRVRYMGREGAAWQEFDVAGAALTVEVRQ